MLSKRSHRPDASMTVQCDKFRSWSQSWLSKSRPRKRGDADLETHHERVSILKSSKLRLEFF